MSERMHTRWSMIRRAARGCALDRAEFARGYEPIIRGYLASRWRQSRLLGEIDDATQEAFLAFFKEGGALGRADPDRPGGFRAYLFGIVKNVARRVEERRIRGERQPDSRLDLDRVEADDLTQSRLFDRAWAKALLQEANRLQAERARTSDAAARRRVDLLRLRFQDGLPIRDIAKLWDEDPTRLHREYARSRKEFATALREVVASRFPGTPAQVDAECAALVQLLRRH